MPTVEMDTQKEGGRLINRCNALLQVITEDRKEVDGTRLEGTITETAGYVLHD